MALISSFVVGVFKYLALAFVISNLGLGTILIEILGWKKDLESQPTAKELSTGHGYPLEEHFVQTEDGYILSLHRIPHGRNERSKSENGSKGAVLLAHGLLTVSSVFLINLPEQSIGYVLPDAGYDVWIPNFRGNIHSMNHTKYNITDVEFWNFSFDEMAKYDLPAVIDYILRETGLDQLYYIGASQGSTVVFALLAEQPEYNKKIKLNIALCPAVYVGNMKGVPRYFVLGMKYFVSLFGTSGMYASDVSRLIRQKMCSIFPSVCLAALGGSQMLNESRFDMYFSSAVSSTSTRAIAHFGQNIQSGTFSKYDFGEKGNLLQYGQPTPPEYDLSKVSAPIFLMWAAQDISVSPEDVAKLQRKLQSVVESYQVPDKTFSHVDFIIGRRATELVSNKILRTLAMFRDKKEFTYIT